MERMDASSTTSNCSSRGVVWRWGNLGARRYRRYQRVWCIHYHGRRRTCRVECWGLAHSMSLMNVYIAPDGSSALVGVDTEAVTADGEPGAQVTKLAIIAPAGFIAIRGIVGFLPAGFCG